MAIVNLAIGKVLVHEIMPFNGEDQSVSPNYATEVISLDIAAKRTLLKRINAALSNDSKCLQMDIVRKGQGSFLSYVKQIILCEDDATFIEKSKVFADLLTGAQSSRNIPAGILVALSGTIGHINTRKIFAVIKAEPQDGFHRERNKLKLLENIFLTPASRMYKIGMFIETLEKDENDEPIFEAYVFDHLMSKSNRENAATYFYNSFLGCAFANTSPKLTKQFYENTRKFIDSIDINNSQKINFYQDLSSYLRSSEQTIHVQSFAERYLPSPALRDSYNNFMEDAEFPLIEIHKDTKEIESKIRYQKMTFRSDIKITGPAVKMSELMKVEVFDGEADESGVIPKWTKIIIKDSIVKSE